MNDAYKRLREAAIAALTERVDEVTGDAVGDTPIEILFCAALCARAGFALHEYGPVIWMEDRKFQMPTARRTNSLSLFVTPQCTMEELDGWRVDFLIEAIGYAPGHEGWRRLIVECDGHDFHERTKQQAAKDRRRDRLAQERGIQVYRFTGSELWADAWGCAEQVMAWASRGL